MKYRKIDFFICQNLKKKKKNRKLFHKYVLKSVFSQPRQGFGGFKRRNSATNSGSNSNTYRAIHNGHTRPYCPQKKKKYTYIYRCRQNNCRCHLQPTVLSRLTPKSRRINFSQFAQALSKGFLIFCFFVE